MSYRTSWSTRRCAANATSAAVMIVAAIVNGYDIKSNGIFSDRRIAISVNSAAATIESGRTHGGRGRAGSALSIPARAIEAWAQTGKIRRVARPVTPHRGSIERTGDRPCGPRSNRRPRRPVPVAGRQAFVDWEGARTARAGYNRPGLRSGRAPMAGERSRAACGVRRALVPLVPPVRRSARRTAGQANPSLHRINQGTEALLKAGN